MNKKLLRVLAILGLVFMGIFTVAGICTLIDRTLLSGQITTLTISSLTLGLVFFAVIWLNKRAEQKNEQYEREHKMREEMAAAEAEEAAKAAAAKKEEEAADEEALAGTDAEKPIDTDTENTKKSERDKRRQLL